MGGLGQGLCEKKVRSGRPHGSIVGEFTGFAVGLMLAYVPLQGKIARTMGALKRGMLKHSDERVKFMNEVLSGIRIVKMYSWENPVTAQIMAMRAREMAQCQRILYTYAVNIWLLFSTPIFVAGGTLVSVATAIIIEQIQQKNTSVPLKPPDQLVGDA